MGLLLSASHVRPKIDSRAIEDQSWNRVLGHIPDAIEVKLTWRTVAGTWLWREHRSFRPNCRNLRTPGAMKPESQIDVRNQGRNVEQIDVERAAAGHVAAETIRKNRGQRPQLTKHHSWKKAVESLGNVPAASPSVETESHQLETPASSSAATKVKNGRAKW